MQKEPLVSFMQRKDDLLIWKLTQLCEEQIRIMKWESRETSEEASAVFHTMGDGGLDKDEPQRK